MIALPMSTANARQSLKRSTDRLDAFGPIDHIGLSNADATDPLDIEVFQKAPALCQDMTVHGLTQGDDTSLLGLVNATDQTGVYQLAPRLVVFPSLIPLTLSGQSLVDEPLITAQPTNFLMLKATWSFDGVSQMGCAGPVLYVSATDDSVNNDLSGIPDNKPSSFTWAFVLGTWDAKGVFTGQNQNDQPFLPLVGL